MNIKDYKVISSNKQFFIALTLIFLVLHLHVYVYYVSVTSSSFSEAIECTLIITSGSYKYVTSLCKWSNGTIISQGKTFWLIKKLPKFIKVGLAKGGLSLFINGTNLNISYKLIAEYSITVLSKEGIILIGLIISLILIGATYTLWHWKRYRIY